MSGLRIGLLARGEDRGLGLQSWEFYRAMRPAKTCLVQMGELARGFQVHEDRYPDAEHVAFNGSMFPEEQMRAWVQDLDVIFAAETLYDWHLAAWAAEVGCASVVQVNPEFFKHHSHHPSVPHPTAWWAPSPWRLDSLPDETRLVPVPVADDRFPFTPASIGHDGPLRVLHVAGHMAAGDRNGTNLVLQALRRCRQEIHVRVVTQDDRLPFSRGFGPAVKVDYVLGGITDYWDLYRDTDVLLLPRRYGGLCLPAQEAMAAGLAPVMADRSPENHYWPVTTVRGNVRGFLDSPGGRLYFTNADPIGIAQQLDTFAEDRDALHAAQVRAVTWARDHRWSTLRGLYDDELARAAATLLAA